MDWVQWKCMTEGLDWCVGTGLLVFGLDAVPVVYGTAGKKRCEEFESGSSFREKNAPGSFRTLRIEDFVATQGHGRQRRLC